MLKGARKGLTGASKCLKMRHSGPKWLKMGQNRVKMAQNRVKMVKMGQNGPELHWPNPSDPFFPYSVGLDGFQARAPQRGVWSALHMGGI